MGARATACLWRSEDNLVELVLSAHLFRLQERNSGLLVCVASTFTF